MSTPQRVESDVTTPEAWGPDQLARAFQIECRELFEDNPYTPLKDEDHPFHGKFNQIAIPMGKGFRVKVRRPRITTKERKEIEPNQEGFVLHAWITGNNKEIEGKIINLFIGIRLGP